MHKLASTLATTNAIHVTHITVLPKKRRLRMQNVYTFKANSHDAAHECIIGSGIMNDDVSLFDTRGPSQADIARFTVSNMQVAGYVIDSNSSYVAELENLFSSIIASKTTK